MSFARLARVATTLALSATCMTGLLQAQGTSSCLPQDDNTTALVDFAKNLITANSAYYAQLRNEYGLAGLTASDITVVTDTRICKKAVDALNLEKQTPNPGLRVYVVRAGNKRYFVWDLGQDAGEMSPKWLFDSSFKVVVVFKGS
jgi:hypothetical protein